MLASKMLMQCISSQIPFFLVNLEKLINLLRLLYNWKPLDGVSVRILFFYLDNNINDNKYNVYSQLIYESYLKEEGI